jgi:ATP-dependent helicase/DNAse subunit B
LKFSPSSLLCYQVCPYKFYLRYLLNLQPSPRISEYITPQDKGLIFHQALKEIYKEGILKKEEHFLAALKERLLFYFEKLPQFQQQPAARLEIEILLDRLSEFVQRELKFLKEGWCPDIRLIEREIEIEFEGIVLKGIPDRVDRKGKSFRILDYKTGRIPTSKECEIGENFRGIQLPFYLLLLKKKYGLPYEKCEMLGFYELKNRFEIKETYKSFRADPIQYMEQFEDWLRETLKKILTPDNPWERCPGKECDYCDYQDICVWEEGISGVKR